MTPLAALLARLRPLGPPVAAFLARYWRPLAVAGLALVALLALRGCVTERSRADAGAAQVAATFRAELARAYAAQEGLAREVAKAQANGARPVEVGQGSALAVVLAAPRGPVAPGRTSGHDSAPQPAKQPQPASASVALASGAVPSSADGDAMPCVLAAGDTIEFVAGDVVVAEKDGTRSAYVGVTLKAFDPDRDVASAVIRAPLAPAEVGSVTPVPALDRYALRAGITTGGAPVLGADLRLFSRAWAWAEASTGDARLGLRWSW